MAQKFSGWLDTFVEEKCLDVEGTVFEIETERNLHLVSLGSVIAQMKVATAGEQNAIKVILVKIDFENGDVLHFFRHMAKAVAEMYEINNGGF